MSQKKEGVSRLRALKEAALVGVGALSLLGERLLSLKGKLRQRGEEALQSLLQKAKEAGKGKAEKVKRKMAKLASLHPLFASRFEVEELRRKVEALEEARRGRRAQTGEEQGEG